MKKNSETIVDENGIEILVDYRYELSASHQEECHGIYEVGLMVYTELTSVEVVIAGSGIDILKLLTDKEKEFIISKLNYE